MTVSGFFPNIQNGLPCSNTQPWSDGWGYAPTCTTWTVPSLTGPNGLKSGYYMLDGIIPIIIKGDNSNGPNGADIVIVCPTNTINAYTDYSTAYSASSPCVQNSLYVVAPNPITTVSFLRPQNRDRYSNCDDGFLDWIRTWASNHNPVYHLNFISDADMEDWNEIKDAKLLIIPGHSEYWTRQARLNFDRFVDGEIQNNILGKNALILSGNTMFLQVRYEDQNYALDNTKMTCYRGGNWCDASNNCYSEDFTTDPLLATYHWSEPDMKYSSIGSIGSDSWRGGYGNSRCSNCSGQNYPFASGGHRIIQPSSPLLAGVSLPIGGAGYKIIPLTASINNEYDGSFMKSDANGNALDVNGNVIPDVTQNIDALTVDPQLDISALGFYRAEMIGYHHNTTNLYVPNDPNINNSHNSFCPFMIFQKTSTSGIIINVNSNRWCYNDNNDWTNNASTAARPLITANMINLLTNGGNVFSSPAPNYISLKPSYSNDTYVACENGNIHFTDHGIYLNNAYKIDDGFVRDSDHSNLNAMADIDNNMNVARIDYNCSIYHPLRRAQIANNKNIKDNEQTDELSFSLFPNPTTDKFNLQMLSSNNSEKNVFIFNSINQEIFHNEKIIDENMIIDLSSVTKGVYFVKVVVGDRTGIKKIVLM